MQLRRDSALPRWKKSRTDMLLPNLEHWKIARELPIRPKLRMLRLDPRLRKSSMETELPNLVTL
jgi:hypothetical protein